VLALIRSGLCVEGWNGDIAGCRRWFPGVTVIRSHALTTKDTGPMADPWIMFAEISSSDSVGYGSAARPDGTDPYLPTLYLNLDHVPPVPVGTLGSSLSSDRTIRRSVFSLFTCDVGSRQVFLECSVPCLLWTSSSTPAIVWSPRHCKLRSTMVW